MIIEIEKQEKKDMIIREIEHIESKSGEIFYVVNGKIAKCENRQEFDKVLSDFIYQQELEAHLEQHFYIQDGGVRYGYKLKYDNKIIEHISKLGNTKQQVEYMLSYNKMYSSFNFRSDAKGGK